MDAADHPHAGRFVGKEHRFAIRVYYEDTDLSGVVYHANYLRFMERARSDMLAQAGIDQREALDAGEGTYAVTHVDIRYSRPARINDALLVVSSLTRIKAASSLIHQRVMRGETLLAEADVTAAFLSLDGRPKRQPKAWMEAFERLVDEQGVA